MPTIVHIVKTTVFPLVMYGCESWTIKKAKHRRTDAFELWCWRRLLRFPWTARRSNQSIPKEINPEYSLEGLMLKLKLQYFGHLVWKANSLEKTLMLGKIEGRRRKELDGWMVSPTQRTWVWGAPGDGKGQGKLVCYSPWGCKVSDTTEWLDNNKTKLKKTKTKTKNCIWMILLLFWKSCLGLWGCKNLKCKSILKKHSNALVTKYPAPNKTVWQFQRHENNRTSLHIGLENTDNTVVIADKIVNRLDRLW